MIEKSAIRVHVLSIRCGGATVCRPSATYCMKSGRVLVGYLSLEAQFNRSAVDDQHIPCILAVGGCADA